MPGMTTPEIMIRPARIEDAPEINRLSAQLGYPASLDEARERLEALLHKSGEGIYVAELESEDESGSLAAWMQISHAAHLMEAPFAEVIGLVIDEDQRGRGIGAEMLAHAERWAAERGLRWIWVRSSVIRERAHHFYQSHSYSLVKTQHLFVKSISPSKERTSPQSGSVQA